MNNQHPVNAPARSGSKSLLRRFVAAATLSSLMLGAVSAWAGGTGNFELKSSAAAGTIPVTGSGSFTVADQGGTIVFSTTAGAIDMGIRKKHTVGEQSKLTPKLLANATISLTIDKSKLTFPAAGQTVSDKVVKGTFKMLGKDQPVDVHYSVKNDGGKYTLLKASFTLDYTRHSKEVCMGVCVKKDVEITVKPFTIDIKP
jgi:hypothetical protein